MTHLKIKLFILLTILSFHSNAQLAGNYTIGGTAPDFVDVISAVSSLNNNGVSGNVTFDIRPGTYGGQIVIGYISGSSSTSSILFRSESGDTSTVWLTAFSNNGGLNCVVRFDSTKFVKFEKLSVRNTGYSGAFLFENSCSDITIEGCNIVGKQTFSQSSYHRLINSTPHQDSNIYILHNQLKFGALGVYSLGVSSSALDSNIVIQGNTITSEAGVIIDRAKDIVLSENRIDVVEKGIYLYSSANPIIISSNEINSFSDRGIDLYNTLTTGIGDCLFSNNFVTAREEAMYLTAYSLKVFNNSLLGVNSSLNKATLRINSFSEIKNNIIVNEKDYYALYIPSSGFTPVSDNNLFYTDSYAPIYKGGITYNSIDHWNSLTNQDPLSKFGTPNFVSASDFHIQNNILLYNQADVLSAVAEDIDGQLRGALPDIGADEFQQPALDAALLYEYFGVDSFICSGPNILSVQIQNHGLNDLNSVEVHWTINDSIQPSVSYSGTLSFTDTALVDLSFQMLQDSLISIKVWVESPNGGQDIFGFNDTLWIGPLRTRMQGTYTVGGANADYVMINDAVVDLEGRGTCNNVTLRLNSGLYSEEIVLNQLTRHTLNDTLFIQSTALNADSVTWTHGAYDDWAFRAYWNRNIFISDITFKSYFEISGDPYVSVIHFDNCTNIVLNKNVLTTYWNGFGGGIKLSYCDTVIANNNDFINNKQSIYGISSTDLLIKRNEFSNCRARVIELVTCTNMNITQNSITNQWILINGYGTIPIYLSGTNGNLLITRNKIHGGFSRVINLGHFGNSSGGSEVSNNFISCHFTVSDANYAFNMSGSEYIDVVSNSFNLDSPPSQLGVPFRYVFKGPNSLSYGLGCRIMNNCIKLDTALTVFYAFNPLSLIEADFNNIWADTLFNGLETPQVVYNQNSVFIEPSYYSFSDLHLVSDELSGLGVSTGPNYDIDSNIRSNPPTIGASEVLDFNCDISYDSISQIISCDSIEFFLSATNHGVDTLYSILTLFDNNGVVDSIFTNVVLAPNESMDSIAIASLPFITDSIFDFTFVPILPCNDQMPYNDSLNFSALFNQIDLNLGNDTTICSSTQLVLNIDSTLFDQPYIWNGLPGLDTNVASSGVNTFEAVDIYGCSRTDTLNLIVNNTSLGTDVVSSCYSYTWIDGITYTVSNNGATYVLSNVAGCDSVVTLDLTINNDVTGTDIISSCEAYTWIDGNTYSSSNNTATYTLISSAGCDSVVTLDLTIETIDLTTQFNGDTLVAIQSGANYQWIDCSDNSVISGSTDQFFLPSAGGEYAVIVDYNGCLDTTACLQSTVGLDVIITFENVLLYPNPTSGAFSIEFPEDVGQITVEIFDKIGQIISQEEFVSSEIIHSRIDEEAGVYFLRVITNQKSIVIPLVKK